MVVLSLALQSLHTCGNDVDLVLRVALQSVHTCDNDVGGGITGSFAVCAHV